jgi:hypothetical protein
MTRTDLHRPSVINPEDYDFVAVKYDGPNYERITMAAGGRAAIRAHMDQTGGKYSGHRHGGSCHVCGAGALYLAVFHHRPTNTYICTGEDCADKMALGRDEFHTLRKAVAAGVAAATGKKRAETTLRGRGLDIVWELFTAEDQSGYNYAQDTLCNLTDSLVRYGDLTPKQWAYVEKLVEKLPKVAQDIADRAAKLEAQKAFSQHVGTVGERREFIAQVTVRANYETQFGIQTVYVCEDSQGNVIVYKGAGALYNDKGHGAQKGDYVRFKATVKAHGERDGVKQTIVARPVKVGA